ncbi:hypothetical protein FE257_003954 [Aspergillus nanangensis]|uniref:Uncharacterized protein n=1 Tax=Aspergillus nanangensis TaxID=2582783 RepID=A0AAD4CS70_ASPNN|nr:hypothetical protein FE257_003954 [Aspergillus nanangensis]
MPRGAEYDNNIPQSDNAIDAGSNKVHGTNPEHSDINRVHKTADLPDADFHGQGVFPGVSNLGPQSSGSGKGGHEPRTLGENKGTGAHKGTGL